MINFDQDKQRIWQEIHDVLLNIWDPIGVSDIESAQDEYDSYIGKWPAPISWATCCERIPAGLTSLFVLPPVPADDNPMSYVV